MLSDRWTVVAMLGGVTTMTLVFILLTSHSAQIGTPVISGASDGVPAVITTDFVPAGTLLTPDRLEARSMPRSSLPGGAATSVDQVLGRRALVPLFRGEPIVQARVSKSPVRSEALVAPGRTVFALPLEAQYAAGGIIGGGDVISIIGSASLKHDQPLALLADNVEVLGIAGVPPFAEVVSGPDLGKSANGSGAGQSLSGLTSNRDGSRIALLDITLDQAQVLAQAIEGGHIYVALKSRGAADAPVSSTSSVSENLR